MVCYQWIFKTASGAWKERARRLSMDIWLFCHHSHRAYVPYTTYLWPVLCMYMCVCGISILISISILSDNRSTSISSRIFGETDFNLDLSSLTRCMCVHKCILGTPIFLSGIHRDKDVEEAANRAAAKRAARWKMVSLSTAFRKASYSHKFAWPLCYASCWYSFVVVAVFACCSRMLHCSVRLLASVGAIFAFLFAKCLPLFSCSSHRACVYCQLYARQFRLGSRYI